jgi:hypothetical protein
MVDQTRRDRVLPATRVLAVVIVPFLLLAFAVLVPSPTHAPTLFAWPIKPTMSAMVLGSVYLGGAYFFMRVALARKWHTVAAGFVPVGTFATLMGITTVLHWSRFVHTSVAFWLWVGLYFSTPLLVFAAFVRNQREYARVDGEGARLGRAAAGALVLAGIAAAISALLLYLLPSTAVRAWPWHLTPLTARMLAAIFALGTAGVGAAWERRWSAARIPVQVAGIMLVLLLVAGVRAHAEFDTGNALTWLLLVGFAGSALGLALLYLRMEAAQRPPSLAQGATTPTSA